MPRVEGAEEGAFGQRGSGRVIVVPDPSLLAVEVVPQPIEPGQRIVAVGAFELAGEVLAPAWHGGKLILERANDHVPKVIAHLALELSVDRIQECRAGVDVEVSEAAFRGVVQAEAHAAWAAPGGGSIDDGDSFRQSNGPAGWVQAAHRGRQRNAIRGAGDGDWSRTVPRHAFDRLSGEALIAGDELALDIRSRKADLVVEPDPHPHVAGVVAHGAEHRPPRRAHEWRIVGEVAIERAGRRQVDDHEIPDTAIPVSLKLPFQPLGVERIATPPPQRARRILGVGASKLVEQLVLRCRAQACQGHEWSFPRDGENVDSPRASGGLLARVSLKLERAAGESLHVVAHQEGEDDRERNTGNRIGGHQGAELR